MNDQRPSLQRQEGLVHPPDLAALPPISRQNKRIHSLSPVFTMIAYSPLRCRFGGRPFPDQGAAAEITGKEAESETETAYFGVWVANSMVSKRQSPHKLNFAMHRPSQGARHAQCSLGIIQRLGSRIIHNPHVQPGFNWQP